jgi:FtsP/CotA-like multicopper oxidase with cupredoxin domain
MLQDRILDAENRLSYELNEQTIREGLLGDTLFVNGAATPYLQVANRRYRFRILGAANRRAFSLRLADRGPITVIGSDGGLLEAPVSQESLLILNGERWDVVIDFSRYAVGSSVILHNIRAEDQGQVFTNPLPEVLRFDIVRDEPDPSTAPARLAAVERLQPEDSMLTRRFVLDFTDGHWTINGRTFDPARVDVAPRLGTTEIWEWENRSDFPHDLHLHLVQFQILLASDGPPPPLRRGWKDTQRIPPHAINSLIVPFEGYTGRYVFHCHMLEHAEHMMTGQFEVVPPDRVGLFPAPVNVSFACPLPGSSV